MKSIKFEQTGLNPIYSKGNCICITEDAIRLSGIDRFKIFRLSDYTVTSVAAGSIWLIKNN